VMADGSRESFAVEDYAYRLYRELGGNVGALPDYFISALEMSARDHLDMMAAVQPYVDTSISKTVNVPADYPFEAFESLYFDAWKGGLKGLATYRPNETLGAVLSVTPQQPDDSPTETDLDPLRIAIDHRPKGELPAIIEKVEYLTQAGKKSLYVAVSFMEVTGRLAGEDVTIERPIDFFIPVGQRDESQQWITAQMRSLSLAARGGFVARNLQDLRKVSWDRGQVLAALARFRSRGAGLRDSANPAPARFSRCRRQSGAVTRAGPTRARAHHRSACARSCSRHRDERRHRRIVRNRRHQPVAHDARPQMRNLRC
jgi:ribonucleoside-diphosphate reductase alpha chain